MRTNVGSSLARISRKDAPRAPRWLRPILEVPLEVKLLGANLILVGVAVLLLFGPVQLQPARLTDAYIVVAVLTLGATVNFVLVRLALGPIKSIERVAKRVSQGLLGERVPASMVADRELARLSTTINEMLHSLAVDRERMATLGAEVVLAEAKERSQVARELHDKVGTKLADANLQLAAAAAEIGSHAGSSRLTDAIELLREAIEDVRTLSRSSHVHLVTDLGLPKAVEALRDATRQDTLMDVRSAAGIPRATLQDRRPLAVDEEIHELKGSNGTRQG